MALRPFSYIPKTVDESTLKKTSFFFQNYFFQALFYDWSWNFLYDDTYLALQWSSLI